MSRLKTDMAAGDPLREELIEDLAALPEHHVREVHDFIRFLRSKQAERDDPVLDVAGVFDMEPLDSREIYETLYGEDAA